MLSFNASCAVADTVPPIRHWPKSKAIMPPSVSVCLVSSYKFSYGRLRRVFARIEGAAREQPALQPPRFGRVVPGQQRQIFRIDHDDPSRIATAVNS